jgi:hypothetical protein
MADDTAIWQSLASKLTAFREGLTPQESAAFQALITGMLTDEAEASVQGYGEPFTKVTPLPLITPAPSGPTIKLSPCRWESHPLGPQRGCRMCGGVPTICI